MQAMKFRQRLDRIHRHPHFKTAARVLAALQEGGFDALLAGGCVRDSLMGANPRDFDIATSAKPEDVEALFARTLAVGKAFGTIVVVEDGCDFEVTTFRSEAAYLDGRHPTAVEFTNRVEDARRRDFTVNALFYDPLSETLYDEVGGLSDLELRRLRAVGNAAERFQEDHLRMLRAVRFVSQLGFSLDEEAAAAARELGSQLQKISMERILEEVKKFLVGDFLVEGLKTVRATHLAPVFWPEIASLAEERLLKFPRFESWESAYVALSWLSEANDVEERLKSWKASKESLRHAHDLFTALKILRNEGTRAERAAIFGGEWFVEAIDLGAALLNNSARLDGWVKEYLEIATPEGKLPPPWLNGQDLIAQGVEPGARMGALLKELYREQLEGRLPSRMDALTLLKKLRA